MSQDREEDLRVISHELRGTLAPLGTWARLMAEGAVGAADMRHVGEVLERSVEVMTRLAADLATVGDRHRPLRAHARAPLDLGRAVATAVHAVTHVARLRDVAVTLCVPQRAVVVYGDAARMSQAVGNLLDNALKFTDAGDTIDVEVGAGDGQARVTVEDTGLGIEPRFLPFVFDRCTRAVPDDPFRAGSGLGLYVVKRIVDSHGGTVTAASPGLRQGSRFTITLPLL